MSQDRDPTHERTGSILFTRSCCHTRNLQIWNKLHADCYDFDFFFICYSFSLNVICRYYQYCFQLCLMKMSCRQSQGLTHPSPYPTILDLHFHYKLFNIDHIDSTYFCFLSKMSCNTVCTTSFFANQIYRNTFLLFRDLSLY